MATHGVDRFTLPFSCNVQTSSCLSTIPPSPLLSLIIYENFVHACSFEYLHKPEEVTLYAYVSKRSTTAHIVDQYLAWFVIYQITGYFSNPVEKIGVIKKYRSKLLFISGVKIETFHVSIWKVILSF